MFLLLFSLQVGLADTLKVRPLNRVPTPGSPVDSIHLGPPQIRIRTGQGTALVWLVRAQDTVFVAASIPDASPYWGDDFVLSLDTAGDGAPAGGSPPGTIPIGGSGRNDQVEAGRSVAGILAWAGTCCSGWIPHGLLAKREGCRELPSGFMTMTRAAGLPGRLPGAQPRTPRWSERRPCGLL
jgi:hypothetical protein